jgi:L1 cell adhesion molecule like protein
MLNEAQEYSEQDKLERARIEKYNELQSHVYQMEGLLKEKMDEDMKTKIDEMIEWLDNNRTASTEEIEGKHEEFRDFLKEHVPKMENKQGSQADVERMMKEAQEHNKTGETGPTIEEVE